MSITSSIGNILSSRNKLIFMMLLFLIGTIIIILTYNVLSNFDINNDHGELNQLSISIYKHEVIESNIKSSLKNSAYVFLALGAQANQLNCAGAIESLVKYGGWDGDIILFTDQKSCFNPESIAFNAGMDRAKLHYIPVDESFSQGGIDLMHPKVGFRKSRVRSFDFKTRIFDHLPSSLDYIETIAYVDCDILFEEPGCAEKFISTGPSWDDVGIRFSHVYYQKENPAVARDLHAGTFVAHRQYSQETLRLWREQIEKGVDEGDNDAYMKVYNRYEAQNEKTRMLSITNSTTSLRKLKNPMKPGEIMKSIAPNGADNQLNWFEKFIDFDDTSRRFCMNHISKARCSRFGRNKIQEFVNRFHLKTYENGEIMYCTSSFLQPLLYGWFPFGYLPFCPKLETWL